MAYLKITVLVWVDILAIYAVSTLITYLTDVWKINYTHAAAIVNMFWGFTAIMPFTMQYIVDTFLGNFSMVFLSNFAYSILPLSLEYNLVDHEEFILYNGI
ncbi:hypothetical protein G4B88_001716 [Cannabis sativa]|uniref:Uncharacterized protein n=1 Tax=Cannabis sativa TaxID=3483 RepID=A0A7J6I1S8_CANSA|nr:hypothetical protein G4B88_001716 [Cannabis sativa]